MKYYLATNEVDVFHYGEIEDGMDVVTGQPKLLFFDSKEELAAVLESYGQQYQEPIYQNTEDPQIPDLILPEE